MIIKPQVLVADNRYMNNNVIKYAYENNIRLIPNLTESNKSKPKNKENSSLNQISHMTGKQTHSFAQWMNNYFTKTIEN